MLCVALLCLSSNAYPFARRSPDLTIHAAADRNPSSLHQSQIQSQSSQNIPGSDHDNHGNDGTKETKETKETKDTRTTNPSWHLNAITPGRLARLHFKCSKGRRSVGDTLLQKQEQEQKPKSLFIYISTDYVFPGNEPPYRPDAATRPLNMYGESKRAGEIGVLEAAAEEAKEEKEGEIASASASNISNVDHAITTTTPPLNNPGSHHNNKALILRVPLLYGHTEPNESPAQKGAVGVLVDTVMAAAERVGAWTREMRKWRKEREGHTNTGNGSNDDAGNITSEQPKLQKTMVDNWARRYPTCVEDVAAVLLDLAEVYLDDDDDGDDDVEYTTKNDNGNGDVENQNAPPANRGAGVDTNTGTGIGSGPVLPQILHFTAEQPYTKYEMCRVFADILGLNVDEALVPDVPDVPDASDGTDDTSTTTITATLQRPYDTHLDVSATKRVLQLRRERKEGIRRGMGNYDIKNNDNDDDNDAGTNNLNDSLRHVDFEEWWYVF